MTVVCPLAGSVPVDRLLRVFAPHLFFLIALALTHAGQRLALVIALHGVIPIWALLDREKPWRAFLLGLLGVELGYLLLFGVVVYGAINPPPEAHPCGLGAAVVMICLPILALGYAMVASVVMAALTCLFGQERQSPPGNGQLSVSAASPDHKHSDDAIGV